MALKTNEAQPSSVSFFTDDIDSVNKSTVRILNPVSSDGFTLY